MPITFDRHKIYNRVPARNWGPVDQFTRSEDNIVSNGVSGSVVNYFTNSNNYAQSLVDKANEIIDTRRYPIRTEDDDALALGVKYTLENEGFNVLKSKLQDGSFVEWINAVYINLK